MIQLILWAVLAVFAAITAGVGFAGYRFGTHKSQKSGIVVGITILAILLVLLGGAKLLEGSVGPIVVFEAGWFASALNFALVAGYIAGKNRAAGAGGAAEPGKRVLPLLCIVLAAASLFVMGSVPQKLADVLQTLGIGKAHEKPAGPDTSLNCKESLTRIYSGFAHYVDTNGALPPAAKWSEEEDLAGQVQANEWFHCPAVSSRKDDKYGYAYNDAIAGKKLDGKPLKEMPDAAKTPLVFDSSNLAKNAHDPMTSLPKPGRHGGKNNILYCDGHIEAVAPK